MDLSRFHQVFAGMLQITEVVPFGVAPREVRSGKAEMPPEGVRSNLIIEGTVSGQINGRWECVDYYRILPNGDGRSHSHGIITTEDGQRIDVQSDGVSLTQPGQKRSLLRQTVHLYSPDPALRWVNLEPLFLVGETNLETYEIAIRAYAAMEQRAAQG